ncbi:Pc12g12530 [Penicillium rubens Wisconsin 54-1255]|uniref:Pc12g12530 protein n=1 Tax=Penicillium rubens (strain ATCC 28089 / DSM 1075 / NRRL 1951 / Wisconsin 54-1255) TaxID=500485 RepID=B6GYN6_PENRW|nr:Pc12g12530 [Penicillium rubens Wisconsin 54-1255]
MGYALGQRPLPRSHGAQMPGELNDESHDLTQVPEEAGPLQTLSPRPPSTQWKASSRNVDETLAKGLSNEDLWMLIRRFNKQIYHVKAVHDTASLNLDLNRTENEQFPPEKLRITLERFYTSVVVGVTEFFRHITRLRSWKEPVRTTIFCACYFAAWAVDLLVPTISGLVVALIMVPPVRQLLFPGLAKADDSNGIIPTEGEVQSEDSLTGAPENHKGEAAEQEAKNLVDSFATVAMESAAAKYGQTVPEDAPDRPALIESLEAAEAAAGTPTGDSPEDKTKKPMKKKVSHATDNVMRVLSDITDIYEKFANILSPTPPFFLVTSRLRLASIFTLVSVIVPFTSSYWIIKLVGFALGLGFFGDPIFTYTLDLLDTKVPNWKDHLDLQKTLLAGVPTNAQLTLTLLRIGEINSSPLPPAPSSDDNEPVWPIRRKKSQAASSTDVSRQGSSVDLQSTNSTESLPETKVPKKRFVFKLLKFFKRTISTAIKGHIAFDRAMAIAGSAHTKNLIGMLQNGHFAATPFGPLKFDAKYERKRGAAVIDSSKEPPILYFTTYQSSGLDDLRIESRKKGSVLFQIPVTEIKELKKTEGLGWKGKLIVELTAGSKEAADGLVVNGDELGQSYHLTGMRSRNQLFNRLVAIDAQFWESR